MTEYWPLYLMLYVLWNHWATLSRLAEDVVMDLQCWQLERRLAVSWNAEGNAEVAYRLLRRG